MSFRNSKIRFIFYVAFITSFLNAGFVNVTTKYGKTGGIIGSLNKTTDKINGRTICPNATTPGCDFANNPGYDNNGTVEDPSDDFYTGDLRVRTNDYFEAIAAWTWNNSDGDGEEKVTITGTLPLKNGVAYYEWANLPGFCEASDSSLSEDKQTIVCVRKDFDKHKAGTYSEDLPFQVRVKGGAPDGTQPGDIKFKIESLNADTKEDTTDNNTLTITGSPKWNIYVGHYPYFYTTTNPDTGEKGYYVTLKFRIGPDEVDGEEDNTNPALGNESMGKDATFEFTDVLDKMSPHAKLLYCSTKGRTHTLESAKDDGFIGYDEPITYYGEGSIHNYPQYKDRHILAQPNEQKITCSKSGNKISVKIEHVDATLNSYPTKNYLGQMLPKSRALASIATIHFFVPYSDIKKGNDNTDGTTDDYRYAVQHHVVGFNPTSPSGNANFNGEGESEKDNQSNFTLPYPGGWSHGWRGKETPNSSTGYIFQLPGGAWVSGDGVVTAEEEISTYTGLNGRDYSDYQACEMIDAYRAEIVPINENKRYKNIGERFVSDLSAPVTIGIGNDTDSYTDGLADDGSGSHDFSSLPYTVEYAAGYVDDSFLPSKGGDTSVSHENDIKRECTDPKVKWYSDFATARAKSPLGVTKVRFKLKPGKTIPIGTYTYFWVNTHIRMTDLATNAQTKNKDLIVNYGSRKIDNGTWVYSKYTPKTFDKPHVNQGWGDRVAYTGPKARIAKAEDKSSVSFNDEIHYTLKPSYTVGTTTPLSGDIKVVDMLPKDFKYRTGSSISTDTSIGEPTIGECSDIKDLDASCDDNINQVLIWDLGTREANAKIADINYTVDIGSFAKIGISFNKVKIESSTDISALSKRKAEVGANLAIPSAIDIVKITEDNPDYPSLRERTTTFKDINFAMNIRNGKDGDISDLDVIDLLPFKGDGEKVINFLDLKVYRDTPTSFHGSMQFHNASFAQHSQSETVCDAQNIKYYYTNEEPTKINMAPTVSDENKIGNAKSIWCEGDENGPNGCTISSSNFTFTDNSQVTAVRVRGATMQKQAICQFKVNVSVKENLEGDNYSNSAGASATGITLPVLSNSKAVPIVGSTIGDYVWFDENQNGIQDTNEHGVAGVKVELLDSSDKAVNNPITGAPYVITTATDGKYIFSNLSRGNFKVKFTPPAGYAISPKGAGSDKEKDSDINPSIGTTDTITLDINQSITDVDMGLNYPIISGDVYDDGNGDSSVNGELIYNPDNIQLYATLVDAQGKAIATKPIAPNGTYRFDGKDGLRANSDYTVVLSSEQNTTTPKLPANWNSTGENINSLGAGKDGTPDGKISVSVKTTNITKIDFGINRKPVANDKDKKPQYNPGGTTQVPVGELIYIDKEDGIPNKVTITELPASTVGEIYYNGTKVEANKTIENFDPSKLTIDPADGDQIVIFKYTTTDAAGVISNEATVTAPFKEVCIGNYVWEDSNANGIQDANEKPIKDVLVKLYDAQGGVVAQMSTGVDGNYTFCELAPGDYHVEIVPPTGYKTSPKGQGGNSAKDSDIDSSGKTKIVNLELGEKDYTWDAGLFKPACVGDYIWNDKNANGIQDAGEAPVGGATITILKANGNIAIDADGDAVAPIPIGADGDYHQCD